jgi:hypothetical protein
MHEAQQRRNQLESEDVFELPGRHVLTLIDPSLTGGLLSYANAAQSAPTTQGGATSSPLYTQGLSAVSGAAQTAHTAQSGGTVQNFNSSNSSGLATTSGG